MSIFIVNDVLHNKLIDVTGNTTTFSTLNTIIGVNDYLHNCAIRSLLTVDGDTTMNKTLHIVSTHAGTNGISTDIFKITEDTYDAIVVKNATAMNNNTTTLYLNCDTNIGDVNNPFHSNLNINSETFLQIKFMLLILFKLLAEIYLM